MGLMVNPPKPGDISYEQYHRERYAYMVFERLSISDDIKIVVIMKYEP